MKRNTVQRQDNPRVPRGEASLGIKSGSYGNVAVDTDSLLVD